MRDKVMSHNHWSSIPLFSAAAFVIISSLLIAGCAGVCIVDADRSSVIIKRDDGTFREEPVYMTEHSFATLKRTETNTFVCKEYNFAGKEISRTYIPLLFTSYGDDEYAFSPDGQHLAYMERFDGYSRSRLRVFSITKEGTKPMLTNPGPHNNLSAYSGYKVFWVDATTILLYAKNAHEGFGLGHKENSLFFHLENMGSSEISGYYDSSYGPVLLSPSKRYLLASEEVGTSTRFRFHIVDLKAEKEVFTISPAGEDFHVYHAVWSSDDGVVYAVDNVVYEQKIGSSEKREIIRVKSKRGIWLHAVDCKRNLHYQMIDTSSGSSKEIGGWRTHNLDTHEDKELTGEKVHGRVLMTPHLDKIVTTVGF